jgi:single-strand DNA-binding protein
MLNKVFLIGNLTRDPELRYTPSGKPRAVFGLAVNRRVRRESGDWEDQPDFFNIVAWEKQAEFAHTYLNKGKPALIEGRLQVRSFTGQDGAKRTVTEVVAERISFVGGRAPAEGAPPSAEGAPPSAEGAPEEGGPPAEEPDVLGDV